MLVPSGYTYAFLRQKYFVSVEAETVATKHILKARRRGGRYAILDSILTKLHGQVLKKKWNDAFVSLEVLTLFNDQEDEWPMADDGERTDLINRLSGALLVTTLRALKQENRLNAEAVPSLETVLRMSAIWGSLMKDICCKSDYDLVCKAIGARLELAMSQEDQEARVKAWLPTRSEEERVEYQQRRTQELEDLEDEEDEAEEGPWFAKGEELDEDTLLKDKQFDAVSVWKKYRGYVKPAPV